MSTLPVVDSDGTATPEQLANAHLLAACIVEAVDPAAYGITEVRVMDGHVGVLHRIGLGREVDEIRANVIWRATQIAGPDPGSGAEQTWCWPCYLAYECWEYCGVPCTHDPDASEQPPPLPRGTR